jgi:arsenite/tail-anchored protein-transporting ATPase
MEEELPPMEPNLEELVNSDTRWVFVGGKGGVGKTTTSCSIGMALAARRERVLIVSTDPAHNLSDAFGQKFGATPLPVTGQPNLFCLEMDSSAAAKAAAKDAKEKLASSTIPGSPLAGLQGSGGMLEGLSDMITEFPGVDESVSFLQMLSLVESLHFDCVVFDTAPTGHTLRLLALPKSIDKLLATFTGLQGSFGPLLSMLGPMMTGGAAAADPKSHMEQLSGRLASFRSVLDKFMDTFHNPDLCTFVCVCIPEFLSVYETERLVQELGKHEVDVANIVVNQVLWPDPSSDCAVCAARRRIQGKYLAQIDELYQDFHVAKMPLMSDEVRGLDSLRSFGRMLVEGYSPPTPE